MSRWIGVGRWFTATFVAAVVLVARASALAAQAEPPSPVGGLEVWGGYASNSPQWGLLGEAPGMNLALLGVRWTRAFGGPPSPRGLPRFEFGFDVIPIARISPPLISLRGTGQPCTTASLCVLAPDPDARRSPFPDGSPAGIGANPIVLTRRFDAAPKVSFSLGATAGFLWFQRRVPTTQASRLNATAGFEAGMRFGRPQSSGLTLTYRFHHLSNAGRAGENPGLASHLLSVGFHQARVSGGQVSRAR